MHAPERYVSDFERARSRRSQSVMMVDDVMVDVT
jgi:hypothetical protein